MARKAAKKPGTRKTAGKARERQPADMRAATIDAAMALAAKTAWRDVTLQQIAAKAKVPLADIVEMFDGKFGIVRGMMRRIDREVLDSFDPSIADEPARERLFDVFISRLEAMTPYKDAIRSITDSMSCDLDAMLAMNRAGQRSVRAMMAGAGLDAEEGFGALRVQGLVILFARVMKVWLGDDDPGMARTMAELDRRLRDGERILKQASGVARVAGLARAVCAAFADRRRSAREATSNEA